MSQDRKPGRVRVVSTSESTTTSPAGAQALAEAPVLAPTGARRTDRTPLLLALLFLAGAAAGGIGTVASGLAR